MKFSLLVIVTHIFGTSARFETIPIAADSSSTAPFAVKIRAEGVEPTDTTIKFCVWVYDKGTHRYISQIWTKEGWKSGWTYYQPFQPSIGLDRTQWVYLRIYKQHTPDSFYIKFKFKDSDTAETDPTYFQILNMAYEGGWLAGTVYKDMNFTTPYPNINVIARNSAGNTVGAYVTEDNLIDEGNPTLPGRFYIAVPVGYINSIVFEDSIGKPVIGYITTSPPWQIIAGETTWVDPLYIENVEFIPDYPEPGDSVIIRVKICNTGDERQNASVSATYKKEDETSKIGEVILNNIPAQSYATTEIIWKNIDRGRYQIEILVIAGQFKTTTVGYLQVGAGEVIINEIMYSPTNSGEWLEIINHSQNPINLKDWSIDGNIITDEDKWLSAGGFAVIAESTAQVLKSIYGEFDAEVFSLGSKFPNLRNAVDTVILKDEAKLVQDILRYEAGWSDNPNKGVSLERISPIIATNDPNNWGACVVANGGTPGKVNSIYAEYLPNKTILSVQPRVFSPPKEVVFISYTLPFTKALIRLYLYDKCGRCVRKLIEGYPSGAQSRYQWEKDKITWSHIWDGRNDKGQILPIGIYIIYLEAKDQLSDALISQKATVVIAK